MKKLSILFTFLIIGFQGFSQTGPDTTLQSPGFGPGNVIIYGIPNAGYLTGTGQFSEFYMKYSLKNYATIMGIDIGSPSLVDKVFVLYGKKTIGSNPGYVKSGVYKVVYNADANLDGSLVPHPWYGPDPNGPLGLSDSVSLVDLSTPSSTFQQYGFNYSTPVAITQDSFFVSVRLSGADGDTLVVASTRYDGPTVPFPRSSWASVLISGSPYFYDFYYYLHSSSINSDIDLGIFPHITHGGVGINEVNGDNLFVMPFPNPANKEFNVGYDITKSGTVAVTISDVTGRMVTNLGVKNRAAGTYNETIDVSSYPAGVYIYKVETAYGSKTGKFYVGH